MIFDISPNSTSGARSPAPTPSGTRSTPATG